MAATARKKKTTKKRAPEKAVTLPPLPIAEIVAVLLGTAGIILLLALVSYHPTDPSWNTGGTEAPPRNWVGSVGANMAESLLQLLGVPAVMVPVALMLLALSLFRHHGLQIRWTRVFAGGALTFFSSILLAIYPATLARDAVEFRAGGLVGEVVSSEMILRLNTVGTVIIVLAALIIALQMTLALEIGPAVLRAVGLMSGAAKVTGGAVVGGAGAVGGVAKANASSLGQWVRDSLGAWAEERERRRLEAEEEYEEEQAALAEAQKQAPALRGKGVEVGAVEGESSREGANRRRGKRGTLASDIAPDAANGVNLELFPASGAGAPVVSRNTFSPSKGPDIDDDLLEPSQNVDFDLTGGGDEDEDFDLSSPDSAGDLDGRNLRNGGGRKKKDPPGGPKIIKSKYMEETPGQFSSENPYQEEVGDFELPPLSFLKTPPPTTEGVMSEEDLLASARLLEEKLRDYGVEGRVVEIHPGPVITMYEYAPAPGVKVSKITSLSNDLALALRAAAVRIVAPIPGKAAVGIEVPNKVRQMVYLREILDHEEFRKEGIKLPIAIGKDIAGKPYAGDLAKMPHLLVAGSTGAGKSVAVNVMLLSLFYARKPEEVRLILVDPKMIEFSVYNDIPHLLMPVVTDPTKAASALNWGVEEMERRYRMLTIEGARNIANYNGIMEERMKTWTPETAPEGQIIPRKLPYIVIVIDELADLMMVAGKEVQDSIVRLAQKARAAGIHLIVATQRPSVDVITGLIKANFPARIAFKVASKTDSRTILDANGAEYLLGNGDMLHVPPGSASLTRLHGAFTSDDEARLVAEHLRKQGQPRYEESLLASTSGEAKEEEEDDEDRDEFYEQAKAIVLETGQASISTIQRRLKIGYNRSARMVERMAKEGLVGPPTQAGKPREIFIAKLQASLR